MVGMLQGNGFGVMNTSSMNRRSAKALLLENRGVSISNYRFFFWERGVREIVFERVKVHEGKQCFGEYESSDLRKSTITYRMTSVDSMLDVR